MKYILLLFILSGCYVTKNDAETKWIGAVLIQEPERTFQGTKLIFQTEKGDTVTRYVTYSLQWVVGKCYYVAE